MDQKRNVSVRLSVSDIKKAKEIAQRLGVKESELIRYSIKNMLIKLMPLSDEKMSGADLIPTWLECGNDLLGHFDIDVDRLEEMFNQESASNEDRIDSLDLHLMILSNFNKNYAVKKLSEICGKQVGTNDANRVLQNYLYDKYVLGKNCECDSVVDQLPLQLNSSHEYAAAI